MTYQQALEILTQAAQMAPLPYPAHMQIQEAIKKLLELIEK